MRPRRVPLPVLAFITVLPALIVSAVILWQHRSPSVDAAGETLAASTDPTDTTDVTDVTDATQTASTLVEGAGRGTAGYSPGTAPSSGPRPAALGIPAPEISAQAAIVVDDASMEVLYGKDPYSPRPPASVTKMATAVVALERGRLEDVVTSGVDFWELALEDGSTMGLEPGDRLTLRELLYGLMLVSGNDAAVTIAEHISGTEARFVEEMNDLAGRLGMTSTRFRNASGLSAPGHESSPWDLVLLGRYLMRFPDLRAIVGTEEHLARGVRDGEPVEFDLYNHNPLLNYTEGVDGLKTGFTEEAGRTFALTAERAGHRIYIVLMDSELRAQDAIALVQWAYQNHVWPGDTEPPGGEASPVAAEVDG